MTPDFEPLTNYQLMECVDKVPLIALDAIQSLDERRSPPGQSLRLFRKTAQAIARVAIRARDAEIAELRAEVERLREAARLREVDFWDVQVEAQKHEARVAELERDRDEWRDRAMEAQVERDAARDEREEALTAHAAEGRRKLDAERERDDWKAACATSELALDETRAAISAATGCDATGHRACIEAVARLRAAKEGTISDRYAAGCDGAQIGHPVRPGSDEEESE